MGETKLKTHTMLPMIRRMQEAYKLSGVTVVADAGMFSAGNKKAIVDSGLHYILSVKTPNLPEVIAEWRKEHPGEEYEHGQVWRQPSCTDGRKSGAPDSVTFLSGAVVGKRVSVGWKAPVFLCGGGGDFLVGDG